MINETNFVFGRIKMTMACVAAMLVIACGSQVEKKKQEIALTDSDPATIDHLGQFTHEHGQGSYSSETYGQGAVSSSCPQAPIETDPMYSEQFNCLAADLMGDLYMWEEGEGREEIGNWFGDMQNDATSFGPEFYFTLYEQTGKYIHYAIAMATITQEIRVFSQLAEDGDIFNDPMALFEFVSGLNSLLSCVEHGKPLAQNTCRLAMKPLLLLVSMTLLSDLPEQILDPVFFESFEIVVYARVIQANLTFHKIDGDFFSLFISERLLEKLETRVELVDEFGHLGERIVGSWDGANALLPYGMLYGATHKQIYKQKFDVLVSALDAERQMPEFGTDQVYNEHPSGSGWGRIAMSGHMQYIDAFLQMYEGARNDSDAYKYRDKAEGFLSFARDVMFLHNLGPIYDDLLGETRLVPHFSHDISWDPNFQRFNFSHDYCLGCSFFMANMFLKHHELTK